MTKKTKKLLWIGLSLFVFNWLLTMIGWSPFGWHYFFPDYYDDVRYWAPAWMDNDHILFMKGVSNWRMETPFLIFDGKRPLDYKTYLCSMKIDGSEKKEILELPVSIGVTNISSSKRFIVLSGGFINNSYNEGIYIVNLRENTSREVSKTGVFADISQTTEEIVYSGKEKENTLSRGEKGIWVMDINGQNKSQLTNNSEDNRPHWSPNGKMIAFERNVENKGKEVWIADKEGKEQRKVSEGGLLDWFDDNKRLWTYGGSIDLYGNLLLKYDASKIGANAGHLSSDNTKMVSEAYFSERPSGQERVFHIGDIYGNKIYEEINHATINYGKRNHKQNCDIWINSK